MESVHILHLEDDPLDTELVEETLRGQGLPARIDRVDTLARFREALESGGDRYTLILSDYAIPGVNPEEALGLARAMFPQIPVIFLSGTIGEERAVELLHLGASDCVLKQRLGRLAPAVRRALHERREHARRRETEIALAQSEERLRTLADNIAQLAWMADEKGEIFWFNRRFFEYTGATPEEMKGWGWCKVQHPDHVERVVEKISRAFADGEAWEDTFPLRGRDGSYRWFLSRAIPTRDEEGKVLRWLGTNTDITEQRESEEILRQAKEAAEAGNRAKDRFLLTMSHELRTPLTVTMGMLELALLEEITPELRQYLEAARRSSETLLTLISDILDFSGIEKGHISLKEESFALQGCLQEVVDALIPRAREKNLPLVLRLEPGIPQTVIGDRGRLQQILKNIIGNAIRFTPRGEVTVSASAGETRQGRRDLVFSVRDTGIGIAEGALAQIFDSFSQADMSLTRRFGGAGLGLAISRGLVERMGGRIEAESRQGEGSLFSLVIPFRVAGEESFAPAAARAPSVPDAGAPRILVAEDETTIGNLVRMVLEREGWETDLAQDGLIALERWERGDYDLILMDLQMPVMDGLETTRAIRRQEGNRPRTPIIALTAHARQEDMQACREAGMDDVLIKPVRMPELVQAVRTRLQAS